MTTHPLTNDRLICCALRLGGFARSFSRCSLFSLLLAASAAHGQTNVDILVRALDSLSVSSVNHWRMSPDLKTYSPEGDPSQPGFDDSRWTVISLNQNMYADSCWFRKEIIVPARILGTPAAGSMRLLVSVDDFGAMFIDGTSRGHIPWDGDFEVAPNVRPGQKVLVAIKAINTGGPLRLIRAELRLESLRTLKDKVDAFSLSLRVGQKLLSSDTYQTNATRRTDPGIDRSLMDREEKRRLRDTIEAFAANVDLSALTNVSAGQFESVLADARLRLRPVSDFAKRFTLYFTANAHIDAAWLWRDLETIEVCNNTFRSVFNMFDARRDFTYTQSQAALYEWMETHYPETFNKIRHWTKEGRWEITGGMWVEPDCNLIAGESWARQLLYAKRYFRKNFNVNVTIGWNPDSFGYTWGMPMFYRNAGIDAFITQKIGWNETNVFPHRLFWWEAPDGSRILSYFPFDYVNEVRNPYGLVDWMRQFEANTGLTKQMVLFGVGDHGGGPSLEMMDRIDRLRSLDIFPSIEFGTTAGYLAWIRQHDLSSLPVWKDELYLEYHQGTFTTQAATKAANRKSEVLLTNTEKFSSVAGLFGRPYNGKDIESAWRSVLFNQFHDILPGSGIRENYIDAQKKYDDAAAIGSFELNGSLKRIAQQVNTSGLRKGMPVVVFNPLSWIRTDIVRVPLPAADDAPRAVFDANGREIASQIVQTGRYEREAMFVAPDIPSLGYALFEIRKQRPHGVKSPFTITQTSMENEFFRVAVNPATGWLSSIVDKRSGREVLDGPGNELQILEDVPKAWDAWNIGLTGTKYPSRFRRIEILENGPVRTILRLHRTYLKPGTKKEFPTEDFPSSFFTQDIVLYNGLDRIDFAVDADWWETRTMVKVAFPLAAHDSVATFEIPYGTIQRSTQMRNSWETAKVEVPAMRWADISSSDFGAALINNSKYGYDVKGNTIRLSLLRSPKWPDPTADRGMHHIEFSLYPHAGRWNESALVRRGYEFNAPLLPVVTDAHRGPLPAKRSFVAIEPENLVLTSIKKSEDGNDWIVQWYDALGEGTTAALSLPKKIRQAWRSNFLEDTLAPARIDKERVMLPTPKLGIGTVRLRF